MGAVPIRVLTRYSRRAGSSRLRHHIYLERLATEGHAIAAQAFFRDSHLDAIYGQAARPPYGDYVAAYIARARFVRQSPRDSVGWIEKEVFPRAPAAADLWAMRRFRATVIDLDDAWFLRYEQAGGPLAGKMTRLFEAADIVTVPNLSLHHEVARRGARQVRIIGQAIDAARYAPREADDEESPVTIGWIGTPLNAAEYLPPLAPILNKLTETGACRVLLVGAGSAVPELRAERLGWSEATEVESLRMFDIGIMPLTDTLWNRCKSGFKLVQSMACGQAAVGSAVGFNTELIAHGENGMLVDPARPADWGPVLAELVRDRPLRQRLGRMARESVVARYSIGKRADEVAALFRELG